MRSYCCYGNLLLHENDNNVSINDWAVFGYHDCGINWLKSESKSWKVLEIVLRHLNLNKTRFVLCGKKMLFVVNKNIGHHSV